MLPSIPCALPNFKFLFYLSYSSCLKVCECLWTVRLKRYWPPFNRIIKSCCVYVGNLYVASRRRRSCISHMTTTLPQPGFEPGLPRPQRGVLTTRRLRRWCENATADNCFQHSWLMHVPQSTVSYGAAWRNFVGLFTCLVHILDCLAKP